MSAILAGFRGNCSGCLHRGNTALLMARARQTRFSSDMDEFKAVVEKATNVVFLTGAGISAESGIPTFRGAGGFWRQYQAQSLASPGAFAKNPSLVWEFYHYRRELVQKAEPNKAHYAIADFERRMADKGGRCMVITQNIDELHKRAGTKNIIELHGSLFKTRCTKCKKVQENHDSPICQGLAGRGAPDVEGEQPIVPTDQLPQCKQCKGLLRPHVVWFGENLDERDIHLAEDYLDTCDLCCVVGTSAIVYPAASFAPMVAYRGVPVAEFNIEQTDTTKTVGYFFSGRAGKTLPKALSYEG